MTAAVFAVLALLLAGPVPHVLSRARWPMRAPRAALVLWQAVAIAAVLSAFSAGLAVAARLLVPGPDGRPTTGPLGALDDLGAPLWAVLVTVLVATLLVGARLIVATTRMAVHTRRRRARHRTLIDLLHTSAPVDAATRTRLRVLDTAQPLAYCLPGLHQRIVLSTGTLDRLDDAELSAVLAHEHAHLRARHDLVLEAFSAVYHAFPKVVRSAAALDAVAMLVEMLADDAALRVSSPAPLARALVTCADAPTPAGAMAATTRSRHTLARINRLHEPADAPLVAGLAYLTAATILIVPTIAVAVPWLTEIRLLLWG